MRCVSTRLPWVRTQASRGPAGSLPPPREESGHGAGVTALGVVGQSCALRGRGRCRRGRGRRGCSRRRRAGPGGGGSGDLGGVVAVANGLCGVPGAQRESGELARIKPGGAGALLDDQRDGLGDEGTRDGPGTGDAPKDRPAGDLGCIEPRSERSDWGGARRLGVEDEQLVAASLLVGFGAGDPDSEAVGRGGEVLDGQGGEL